MSNSKKTALMKSFKYCTRSLFHDCFDVEVLILSVKWSLPNDNFSFFRVTWSPRIFSNPLANSHQLPAFFALSTTKTGILLFYLHTSGFFLWLKQTSVKCFRVANLEHQFSQQFKETQFKMNQINKSSSWCYLLEAIFNH